jgi:integrase
MNDLTVIERPALPASTEDAIRQAGERARAARAAATLRAYQSDWRDFEAACARLGFPADPTPEIVAVYIDQLARAGGKVSTIRRRIAALSARLRAQKREPLSVREEPLASVLRGIRRQIGAPPVQARALEVEELRQVVATMGDTIQAHRDKALLLIGFAGAFRRSELAGMDWRPDGGGSTYVEFVPEGVRVILKRSKTNQTGDMEAVAICRGAYAATCPVAALEAWRGALLGEKEADGPVFRSVNRHDGAGAGRLDGKSVSRIVRGAVTRAARRAGASAEEITAALTRLSGHSLRAGLVTTAFALGLSETDVARQSRHKSLQVLSGYRRHATLFVANVSGKVGL